MTRRSDWPLARTGPFTCRGSLLSPEERLQRETSTGPTNRLRNSVAGVFFVGVRGVRSERPRFASPRTAGRLGAPRWEGNDFRGRRCGVGVDRRGAAAVRVDLDRTARRQSSASRSRVPGPTPIPWTSPGPDGTALPPTGGGSLINKSVSLVGRWPFTEPLRRGLVATANGRGVNWGISYAASAKILYLGQEAERPTVQVSRWSRSGCVRENRFRQNPPEDEAGASRTSRPWKTRTVSRTPEIFTFT